MTNEMALEIYTDSASVAGSTLQEALRVALKGDVQAGLAAKFTGAKIGLISVSGDLIKVTIAYESGDPNAIGKETFGLLGGVVGGWAGGAAGRFVGAAGGPAGSFVGAVLGGYFGGKGGSDFAEDAWDQHKNSPAGEWAKVNLFGVTDVGFKLTDTRLGGVPVSVPTGSDPAQTLTQLHLRPNAGNTAIEAWTTAPNGNFVGPTGQVLTRDPNATGGNYTVRQGNTLWGIAQEHGITLQALLNANPQITHPDLIHPNQVITLPLLSSVSNTFGLTTTTTATPTSTGAISEQPVSADNATLYQDGAAWITGVGNVNTVQGSSAVINNYLSDGFRPAAVDLSVGGFTADYLKALRVGYTPLNDVQLNTFANQLTAALPTDPLVLDLNGDGVRLTDYASDPVLFDADNDGGSLEQTGWVSAQDGIVAYDLNNNGKIDGIQETLSEYFNGTAGTGGDAGTKPYVNGLAALKSLDSNSDSQFTSLDAAWANVKVWVDANHDGKSWVDSNNNGIKDAAEATELKTLTELGITSINLNATTQSGLVRDGNEVLATSTFVQGGVTREAVAANFLVNPNGSTFAASGSGQIVTTQGGIVNGTLVGESKAYVSSSTTGETIDFAAMGVNNASGGSGNDVLTGTAGNNWLSGNGGSDTFNAGAGDDVLLIDAQDLQANIQGGAGTDIAQVVGDAGVTLNLSQAEIEIVQGGRGDDVFIGGGRSSVFMGGGDGDDILIGGAANDALSGENGADLIDGGQGNDVIRGHRGRDQLLGGGGDDLIEGGQDDDALRGGAGNDVLNGGQGDDSIDGGDGQDAIKLTGSYAEYRLVKLDDSWLIKDTVAGRDGADFVKNVESVSFRDVSNIALGSMPGPMPVKDILSVDSTGAAFTRTPAARTIAKSQILGNDIDWQDDTLHITAITDAQGGTAALNANGDVVFTPTVGYTGIMGFKYQVADVVNNTTQVTDTSTGQTAAMKGTVWLKTTDIPNDPLTVDQWYLSEANILPVWANYSGKGVRIGQFETGMPFSTTKEILDTTHADLQANLDPSWLANASKGSLAGEGSEGNASSHATLVAGVMVAAKNGEGAVGVAYDAKIGGHWIDANDMDALQKMAWYDVANNSWVAKPSFVANFDNNPNLKQAFEYAATNGRQGLGTVMVMAGGNDRADGGNANYLSTTNNRFSIAVGAINARSDLGALQIGQTPFSNPGANILTSAPGSNIASTSRMVETENGSVFGSDYSMVQGTSFATPVVSGVVALMLEANPKLGYRDIQEILAISSKIITDPKTNWQSNGAGNWNGGGMHVSHDYGFGEIDARAAVRLAENWISQQTYANEYSLATPPASGIINVAITDANLTGISHGLTVSNAPMKVEHAEVKVNLTHANAGDLIIKLVSPTGTESILMNRPGKTPGSTDAADRGDANFNGSTSLSFTFATVRDWGESANGIWTLKVIDAATGSTGTLTSWSLNLYGKADNGDDVYYYTDEINVAPIAQRALAADADGGVDWINAAAVTGDSAINLSTGVGTIAGMAVSFTTPANIENAMGGEGSDTLTGNAVANMLVGGRGNDVLSGGAGSDYLFGGLGNNTLTGGTEVDLFIVERKAGAVDTITDFQIGGDRIILSGFGSNTYANISLVQEGVNTRANLGGGQSVLIQNTTVAQLNANQFLSIGGGVVPRDLAGYTSYSFGSDAFASQTYWTADSTSHWAGANVGDTANESIFGGSGNDRIYGGAGNDTIVGENASGSTTGGNDVLSGEDGIDAIYGGGGNDVLWGGSNIDFLDGGYGDDVLNLEGDNGLSGYASFTLSGSLQIIGNTIIGNVSLNGATLNGAAVQGGVGNDRFVVAEDIASTASDGWLRNIVNDFDPNNAGEKIDLSKVRSVTSFSELQFNTITAVVDGVQQNFLRVWLGPKAVGTQYITLKNVTQAQLSAGSFIFYDGYSLPPLVRNATITGSAVGDTLTGDAGGNKLDGASGVDTMTGRTGDDTYIVDNASDVVNELPGGGFDTVKSGVTYMLPSEVENLTLTGIAAINGTGNAATNRIVGNAGNNVLDGQGGSDTLVGSAGDDMYIVDVGTDTVVEQPGEGTDTVHSSVSYTLSANIENLVLVGTDSINGTGNALANMLTGNGANNRLDGDLGADAMVGGAGDDTYLVDNAADVVTENFDQGNDTVYASINTTLADNVENLYAMGSNAVNLTGNGFDNVLVGNAANNTLTGAAGNDVLDGGAGADTLIGGVGDDYYVVDNTADVVTENTDEGTDTVQSSLTYTLGATLENLTLAGTAAINGTGNILDNQLVGNGANNLLTGGAGNDTLNGGAGADTLMGGVGHDTYIVDNTADVVTENADEGTDTVQSSLTYALSATLENLTLTGTAAINGTGNSGGNQLIGNSANNVLNGDVGNDTLNGGAGADTLIGGLDNDTYVVENAGDVVIEGVNEGDDTVHSSINYSLGANVERLALISTGTINATGNGLNNMLIGNGADNVLNGGDGDDVLNGQGNATPVVSTISSLVIRAKGSLAYGVSPTMQVRVGGVVVAQMDVTATSYTDYVINPATLGMVAQDIDVVFINDAYDAVTKSDRNLYVQAVIVNGTNIASNDRKAFIDFGGGGAAFDGVGLVKWQEAIWTNGALRINLADSDVLNGGVGRDIMAGGVGNDLYIVDNEADVVNEQANGGLDSVESSVSHRLAEHVEILTLTGAANINATGNAGANTLYGNMGNNTLDGGTGADRMYGSKGDDLYIVDHAGDVVGENYNEGADTIQSSVTYTLGANIESLILTGSTVINGVGNSVNNILTGNSADNVINGGGGDDVLNGQGNATPVVSTINSLVIRAKGSLAYGVSPIMQVRVGGVIVAQIDVTATSYTDYVIDPSTLGMVAEEIDVVFTNDAYDAATRSDRNLYVQTVIVNGTEIASNDRKAVVDFGVGSAAFDGDRLVKGQGVIWTNGALRINLADSDLLDGGGGKDTMAGGVGNDGYIVDNEADVISEQANSGFDSVKSSVSYTLAENIEILTLTGTTNINATGNAGANTLYGNTGNNMLNGGMGADRMHGGMGNDVYIVDHMGDVVIENLNEGNDTVQSSISYILGANLENLTLLGAAAINGTGNTLNNVLTGNGAANVLIADAGNDTLNGAAANDSLIGGAGNDTYMFGRGYGVDTVTENDAAVGNSDLALFGSGITTNQLWFTRAGNNLDVSIIGTSDRMVMKDWYLGSQYHTEQFKTADGKMLLDSRVDALVSAMASFAPPVAGQTTLSPEYETALAPVFAANWQ